MDWIKCIDQMPRLGQTVLLDNWPHQYRIVTLVGNGFRWYDESTDDTFRVRDNNLWHELPDPPEIKR